MLNRRGWDAFRQHSARNVGALPGLVATHLLGQGFIRRRSRSRWLAHQLVFWALVFPLGMYSAATFKMRAAIQLDALEWLPKVAFAAALIAWLAAAFGLVHEGLRAVLARRDRDASDTPKTSV